MNIQEFDFTVNLLECILWQYNEAVRLKGLITSKNTWYEQNFTQFWTAWYTNVFSLITANDFGMSVWGIILGVSLDISHPPDPPGKPIFGFNEEPTINSNQNFERGNFSSTDGDSSLTSANKKLILRMRYFQLVSRGSVAETNQMLALLFDDLGTVYVLDNFDMTITCKILYDMHNELLHKIQDLDLIPRSSGVEIIYEFS